MLWLEAFFRSQWNRFAEPGEEVPERFTFIHLLPGFYLSSSFIVQVFPNAEEHPRFTVKVNVRGLGEESLLKEAENLKRLATYPGLARTVPRCYGFYRTKHGCLLVQATLRGQPIDKRFARRNHQQVLDCVLGWLTDLHARTAHPASGVPGRLKALLEQPVETIRRHLNGVPEIATLADKAAKLAAELKSSDIPLVFAHGDFTGPNILLDRERNIGVIDWEHGDQHGLPLTDFLMFQEFCFRASRSPFQQGASLENAGLSNVLPSAVPGTRVGTYASRLGIPGERLSPLEVAAWTSCLAKRIEKCAEIEGVDAERRTLSEDSVEWVLHSLYFRQWKSVLQTVSCS